MAELSERQWQVYEGIKNLRTTTQISQDMGVTASYVAGLRDQLRAMGVIRRCGDLPAHGRYGEVYPWELVSDQPPTYRPALPPQASLRLEYPQDARRDLTVPPIRHVWWEQWSVQGIATARPDGLKPKDALPRQRVVLATHLPTGGQWAWVASIRRPWMESQTREVLAQWVVTEGDRQAITLVIAAAIGVESVLDLTTDKEHHQ